MTDGVRRNFLGGNYNALLSALERELTPPTGNRALADLLGRSGPLGTPRSPGGLGGAFGLSGALAPPSQRSALGDIFGTHPLPKLPAPSLTPVPVRRKVFFSFHYDDVCRTVQVRQSWRFRRGWAQPSDNFYDKSLWEKSRTESEAYLKGIIRRAMAGSTVTCVLAGSETWDRPYVRFEIAHSLFIKNGLFTVHVHDVQHPQKGTSWPGHNPLTCMGLLLREDGKGRVVELVGGTWQYFELMTMPVTWPRWLPKPSVGRLFALSDGAAAYDYVRDNGYENLPYWAQLAADAAGR